MVETGVETTEADGVTTTEAVPTEAVATGTRVVLLATGYGATGTTLLSGTTEAAGAVLRMTAGVEEFATTAGTDETIGVTIGATGVEETATGVALLAMTGWVKVQGHSVTVRVVACRRELLVSQLAQMEVFASMRRGSVLTSVTVWTLPLMVREVADEQ